MPQVWKVYGFCVVHSPSCGCLSRLLQMFRLFVWDERKTRG